MRREKLGDLFDFLPKSNRKASYGRPHGTFPFFTSSPEQTKWSDSSGYQIEALVFGTGGSASVHHVTVPFHTSTDCLVATCKRRDIVHSRYCYHYLSWNIRAIEAGFRGAGLKHVSKSYIQSLDIPLPPLPEQRRTSEVLDRAEALRTKRRVALVQLDALTQAIFVDMLSDPARPLKHEAIDSLGEHLIFITSGSRGWAQYYASTGSRFIRSLDVQMNRFGVEDLVYVVPPDNAEARRTQVRGGDVLLTITGSRIGRVAAVPDELQGSYISQHVAILRTNSKRVEPTFLAFFLSLEAGGQRQIAKAQYGQTKPGLNFDQIRCFQIPVPSIDLQREFARRVAGVEKLKTTYCASLAELDALFASLQHRAFRGEL